MRNSLPMRSLLVCHLFVAKCSEISRDSLYLTPCRSVPAISRLRRSCTLLTNACPSSSEPLFSALKVFEVLWSPFESGANLSVALANVIAVQFYLHRQSGKFRSYCEALSSEVSRLEEPRTLLAHGWVLCLQRRGVFPHENSFREQYHFDPCLTCWRRGGCCSEFEGNFGNTSAARKRSRQLSTSFRLAFAHGRKTGGERSYGIMCLAAHVCPANQTQNTANRT